MHPINFSIKQNYNQSLDGITVKATLEISGKVITTTAKLDTGCTACIFQRQIGERLELDIESGDKRDFHSIHGKTVTYGHFVTLSVDLLRFDVLVYFVADEFFPRNLLGRHGFLNQVKLGIIDYDGAFFLSRYEQTDYR